MFRATGSDSVLKANEIREKISPACDGRRGKQSISLAMGGGWGAFVNGSRQKGYRPRSVSIGVDMIGGGGGGGGCTFSNARSS